MAVFLPVMLTANIKLSGFCFSTPVTGTSRRVHVLSSWGTHSCSFPWSLLLALGGYGEVHSGRVGQVTRFLDLAFCLEMAVAKTQQ